MAQYDTWSKTKDDITVTISKKKGANSGERLVAFLKWLSENPHPDHGLPGGGGSGNRPDQGLPGGGGTPPKPDQGLPPSGGGTPPKPDQGLPGSQPGVDNTLPGAQPGVDNELPWLGQHADEIAKLILLGKCFECSDESAQPKR
jgi:hypothetical protein